MFGIRRGYNGLIEREIVPLDNRAVGGIIERGGTILRCARSSAFLTPEGQRQALETVAQLQLDGVVVIGGNGSLQGARWLHRNGVATVGIPASIDNDIARTAMALGVDTALNTVVEGMNRIRDTAIAHERAFVVEVMGRTSGYIALMGGLAGGAEIVLIPEIPVSMEEILASVRSGLERGKRHSIIIVAEGFVPSGLSLEVESPGRAIARALEKTGTIETRLTILGHLQRGGSPTAFDRVLACRMGEAAVEWLAAGTGGVMTGLSNQRLIPFSYDVLDEECTNVDRHLYQLVDVLAH